MTRKLENILKESQLSTNATHPFGLGLDDWHWGGECSLLRVRAVFLDPPTREKAH